MRTLAPLSTKTFFYINPYMWLNGCFRAFWDWELENWKVMLHFYSTIQTVWMIYEEKAARVSVIRSFQIQLKSLLVSTTGFFHPRWNSGCHGIYSTVARTLSSNIYTEPSDWAAAMMQDSLTPNLSWAPIETCTSSTLLTPELSLFVCRSSSPPLSFLLCPLFII